MSALKASLEAVRAREAEGDGAAKPRTAANLRPRRPRQETGAQSPGTAAKKSGGGRAAAKK